MKSYISLLFIFILAAGCVKKEIPATDCDLPPTPMLGWDDVGRPSSLNYSKCQYDPQDPNIIYFLNDSLYGLLLRYDRTSKTKTVLDSYISGNPVINKNGWLIYHKFDFNIYKIKSNGDSLTQLTFDGDALYPYWDSDPNYFYVMRANSGKLRRMTSDGLHTDTLNFTARVYVKDSLMVYATGDGKTESIYIRNLHTNVDTYIKSVHPVDGNSDIDFYFLDKSNTSLYYNDFKGLYKIDLKTVATTTILTGCKRKIYLFYTQSPLTGKIMVTQLSTKPLGGRKLYSEYNLFELNMDGSDLKKVEIP